MGKAPGRDYIAKRVVKAGIPLTRQSHLKSVNDHSRLYRLAYLEKESL